MRKKSSLLLRLFVVTAMALGLATMLGGSASAQTTEYSAQCQIAGEDLDQDLECTVVYDQGAGTCTAIVGGTEYTLDVAACQQVAAGEPYQNLTAEGITQIIPEDAETPAPTPTTPAATETPVTPDVTETPVTPAPTETPEEPEELPQTGAGSTAGDSGSATLLGVMSVVLMLAGGLIWRRREA